MFLASSTSQEVAEQFLKRVVGNAAWVVLRVPPNCHNAGWVGDGRKEGEVLMPPYTVVTITHKA
eukprot:gene40393-27487_t